MADTLEVPKNDFLFDFDSFKHEEVLFSLMENYDVIGFFNFKTKESQILKVSKNIYSLFENEIEDNKSLSEYAKIYAEKCVYPEFQEDFISVVNEKNIEISLKKNNTFSYVFLSRDKGKPRHLELKASKVNNEDSKVVICLFDVEKEFLEKEKKENLLENTISKAEQTTKLNEQFLKYLIYDARTPVNSILGFSSIAKFHIGEKEQLTECLDKITFSANQLVEYIDQVQRGRKSPDSMVKNVPCDIREIFRGIEASINDLIVKKNIMFNVYYNNVCNFNIKTDKQKFTRVFYDILSNSCKFIRKNGEILVVVEQLSEGEIGLCDFHFKIQTTGIDNVKRFSKIFQNFVNRKNFPNEKKIVEHGFNMSYTKNLVDLLNGNISVTRIQGNGTEVNLDFTFMLEKNEINLKDYSSTPILSNLDKTHRILIVDDDESNRTMLNELVKEQGYVLEEALDGLDAFERFRDSQIGYYDMILMDIEMPKLNGIEATRKIRELERGDAKKIPIVAVTAHNDEYEEKLSKDMGMNGIVSKPLDFPELIDVLRQFLIFNN